MGATPAAQASVTSVAAYSFDEGQGSTVHDLAGVPHDGTLQGGATWTEEGKYGSAIHFSENGDKVLVPDADELDLTGAFTLEAWVNPDSEKAWRPAISKGDKIGTEEASGYTLFAKGQAHSEGILADGEGYERIVGPEALPKEEWSHLALTYAEGTARLYVNGEEVEETKIDAPTGSEADLEIGHTSGTVSSHFEGLIDEVRVFKGAMEQSEVEISKARPIDPDLLEGIDAFVYRRSGSVHNANFDRDAIDDYRVRADVAFLSAGLPKEGLAGSEPMLFDLVHRTDCVNPDPWHEALGEYELPDIENTEPDPEDSEAPFWVPDPELNEAYESSYYGCLENTGEPPEQGSGDAFRANIATSFEGDFDDTESRRLYGKLIGLGGLAPGARVWSVRAMAGALHFSKYPEPFTYPVKYYGEAFGAPSSPSVPLACGISRFEIPYVIDSPLVIPKRIRRIRPTYDGCSTTDQDESPVEVEMNSCTYTLHVDAENPNAGRPDIACAEEGDEIEIDVLSQDEEEVICTETVPPQSGLEGIELENKGTGSGRYVEMDLALQGLKYKLSGGCVAEPVGKSDGELNGETTLLAENGKEEPIGISTPKFVTDETEWHPEYGVSHLVAGLNWVIATREDTDQSNDIDVVELNNFCARDDDPRNEGGLNEGWACDATALDAKVREAMDHGIVVVNAAWEFDQDVSRVAPVGTPDVLTASLAGDVDGEPGGKSSGCHGYDDKRVPGISFGLQADIAAPVCGDTGGSNPIIAGAITALASQCPADDRAGAEFLVDTLMAEGDTGEIEEGGWEDNSGDEWKEPLLNLRDEEVFDPVLEEVVANEAGEPEGNGVLNHQPGEPERCRWLSHQASSDVDSDGRADLVTVGGEADAAEVFAGAYEGPSEDPDEAPGREGYETAEPATSHEGQIDSALLDGSGQHAIDTADVDGDRNADLVLTDPGGGVEVYPGEGEGTVEGGEEDGSFGEGKGSLGARSFAFDGSADTEEPVAVADVDGDERADLVALRNSDGAILTYAGEEDGSFAATPTVSGAELDSATPDREGEYPLDAIDVTGEEIDNPATEDCRALEVSQPEPPDYFAKHSCADLVTAGTDGVLRVYPGRGDGSFGAPIEAAQLNPIFDDGQGEEFVGLGDVDRDRRADLLTLDGETLKLRLATREGTFVGDEEGEPYEPYEGDVDSSLLDGEGQELIGLLDYSRDGLADLVSVEDDGTVLAYTALRDKTFNAPRTQAGSLPSLLHDPDGHEFVAQKPILRRAGCTPGGCFWPLPAPVAAYSFGESKGDVAHDSAASHDGLIEGGATWSEEGKYGWALSFDGEDDLVTVADAVELDLTDSLTLETWVKPASLTHGSAILYKGTATPSGYALFAHGAGVPKGGVADESGSQAVGAGATSLPIGKWTHLAFTSDGETVRLYVDGELAGSDEALAAAATEADLTMGHSWLFSSVYFEGLIDEVRIYDVALSEAEVETTGEVAVPVPAGVYLSGAQSEEGKNPPGFNAVVYPSSVVAEQDIEDALQISMVGYNFECDDVEFSGQLTEAASALILGAQYSGCVFTSNSYPSTVDMNSCAIELEIANSGPPYTGTTSIACEVEGDEIEIDVRDAEGSPLCLVKFPAQSLGGAVEYENLQDGADRSFVATLAASSMDWSRTGICTLDGKGEQGSGGEFTGSLSVGEAVEG